MTKFKKPLRDRRGFKKIEFYISQFCFVVFREKFFIVEFRISGVADLLFKVFNGHYYDVSFFKLHRAGFSFIAVFVIVTYEHVAGVRVPRERVAFFVDKLYERAGVINVRFFKFI